MSADAANNESKEYDFVIVGSGAGGGPLAARLARAKFRVLLIEAGADHSKESPQAGAHEVSLVPGFQALSTEHPDLSWRYFVKHYNEEYPAFGRDPKWYPNPEKPEQIEDQKAHEERKGIFYPRSAGLGGCTIHNALITITGPDSDWNELADFLGDQTWCGQQMRGYFQQLERNQYADVPDKIPQGWWKRRWHDLRWFIDLPIEFPSVGFSLRAPDYSGGQHGFRGWLHTSVTDIRIGLKDKQLVWMLTRALKQAKWQGLNRAGTWISTILKGDIKQALDPNHSRTLREHPEGVALVPLAACGESTNITQNSATPDVQRGRRSSPRELLRQVVAECPEYLEIRTNCLVTKVLFDAAKKEGDGQDSGPRAVGVEYLAGAKLYRAHPTPEPLKDPDPKRVFVKKEGEVILCGGSFNTPQLLMLSGIGDVKHLADIEKNDKERKENPIPADADVCRLSGRDGKPLPGENRLHLPGVGCNLQDRYEVTVVSQMEEEFSLLDGATFRLPENNNPKGPDTHLKEWRAEGRGLYTSNGAVLGIFKRSRPDLAKPDLFIFGVPLPFYGYEVGYSEVGNIHNLFTWALLKGHTQNHDGTVKLRTTDPRDTPEINFHYFNETTNKDKGSDMDPDLLALVNGVKFIRGITKRIFLLGGWTEKSPTYAEVPESGDAQMKDWIRRTAWGHHATGTCRMGPEGDGLAVLDSRFRVRGVQGLRVVDASIFPKIPGYFIVTNIYIASEKAGDIIAQEHAENAAAKEKLALKNADASIYPVELRVQEAMAITERRKNVLSSLPDDLTGLAVSGGGIRSATFNLGILQAMARGKSLRQVDYLSTVSGGGYIGSFLGRAFDHLKDTPYAPNETASGPDRIEADLVNPASPAIRWLRKYANYIAPSGPGDERMDFAVFLRNIISVHFVVGLLIFAIFGLANALRYEFLDPAGSILGLVSFTRSSLPIGHLIASVLGPFFSPWFTLCEVLVLILVLPRMIGYWIVSQEETGRFNPPALALMLSLASGLLYLGIYDGIALETLVLGFSVLGSLLAAEMVWLRSRDRADALGTGGVEAERLRARTELTSDLGVGLVLAGMAFAGAIIDTLGHGLHQYVVHNKVYAEAFATYGAVLAMLAPLARAAANYLEPQASTKPPSTVKRLLSEIVFDKGLTAILLLVPLVFYSFSAHAVYEGGSALSAGIAASLAALFLSVLLTSKKAVAFANRSSLSETYAARLARTFLGASNPKRFEPEGGDVTEVIAGDDVDSIANYKPHAKGGPLHLINVTVNQTIDFSSQRGNRDRKGDNLMVSPIGISVGPRYHGLWGTEQTESEPEVIGGTARSIIRVGVPPAGDHPLIDEAQHAARHLEVLTLRQWVSISGAAIDPGRGRETSLGRSLLFGLANLRTGYWWNSGIGDAARDGFPSLTRFRRLLYLIPRFFLSQSLLIAEWISRFPGPWEQFWYLSDGGFFEGLGAYELIRRRIPRIIVSDSLEDPEYKFEDFANLIRTVRIDFAASIEAVKPTDGIVLPTDVSNLIGSLDDLKPANGSASPSTKHAALFWVHYPDGTKSILLYIKSSLTGDESVDVTAYHTEHLEFPHESTCDQFFNEPQWESYRKLGEHIGTPLFGDLQWFNKIPL